jgi:hypothetical protein
MSQVENFAGFCAVMMTKGYRLRACVKHPEYPYYYAVFQNPNKVWRWSLFTEQYIGAMVEESVIMDAVKTALEGDGIKGRDTLIRILKATDDIDVSAHV